MDEASKAGDGLETDPEPEVEGAESPGPTIAYVDEREYRCDRVAEILSGSVTARGFTDPSEARDAIDRTLAVLVLVNNLLDDEITKLVLTARQRSPFCHVALVAREVEKLSYLFSSWDDTLTSPLTWGEFGKAIDSLLRRAQYLSGLQHYYKLSLSLNHRWIELGDTDPEADEPFTSRPAELERLEGPPGLPRGPVHRRGIPGRDGEDAGGPRRYRRERTPGDGPSHLRTPRLLSEMWPRMGEWHGWRLGHGFKRIAANVWRCTDCDTVIDKSDASHRRITGG